MTRKEIAAANLVAMKKILDELGIPFCLFLGTALGAYRDKDFCEGDFDDIDIAVHVDHFQHVDRISAKMAALGFTDHTYTHASGIAPEVAYEKNYSDEEGEWRSKIDIFFIVPLRGKMIWTLYTDPPQNKTVGNYFTSFDSVEFYGTEYNIPYPIENYLEENYGTDWKTPIPRSRWPWDSSNRCPLL